VCLPVFAEFMVMPANVWDSLFGTDLLDVNVEQINAANVTGNGNSEPWDGA
jgi:hypothetical protein